MFLLSILLIIPIMNSNANAKTYSWQDCVTLVSQNNPDIVAAKETLHSSEELLGTSKSGFLPSLIGNVNASHSFLSPQESVDYSSSLVLNYNLFSGFKDVATRDKAKGNLLVTQSNFAKTRSVTSDNLRQAFIKFNYAQAYIKLTESIIERRNQNERLVRAQYENGRENQGSYLLSQSKLEQAKFDLLQAKHQAVEARQVLGHILVENADELSITGEVPHEDPPNDPAIAELVALTPDHLSQQGQIEISQANIKLSRSGFLPNLDLIGSVQNKNNLLYVDQSQEWSLGLSLTIPLFSGLSSYHNIKSSYALDRAAVANEVSSDFQTFDRLQQSLFNFQESAQKNKVDQLTLRAIEIQEKIARKQYNNGLMTFENWDIIEGNLVSAQKSALSSEKDRSISESNWRLAQGLGDLL